METIRRRETGTWERVDCGHALMGGRDGRTPVRDEARAADMATRPCRTCAAMAKRAEQRETELSRWQAQQAAEAAAEAKYGALAASFPAVYAAQKSRLVRFLRSQGFVNDRRARKSSASTYYVRDGLRVRISDHEIPITPEREHNAQYGRRAASIDLVLARETRSGYRLPLTGEEFETVMSDLRAELADEQD